MGNSQSCCVFAPRARHAASVDGDGHGQHHGKGGKRDKKARRANGGAHAGSGRRRGSEEYTPADIGQRGHHVGLHSSSLSASEAAAANGGRDESVGNLQHISEREPDDWAEDPSLHPTTETLFMEKSKQAIQNGMVRKRSQMQLSQSRYSMVGDPRGHNGQNGHNGHPLLKKSSSCSTIFLDDSTVSQPNLKNTIKCVALAIYYHIKNRTSDTVLEIFDEAMHPLTVRGKKGEP